MNTYQISIPVRLDVEIDALDLESAIYAIEQAFREDRWKDDLQGKKFTAEVHGFDATATVLGAIAQGPGREL